MKCTCYIGETESLGEPILRKCNLCSAASDMLDACREAVGTLRGPFDAPRYRETEKILQAAVKLAEEGL